jgi:threonylcarbamoyladenosine tRNA methylthiotransferase MtaB
MEYIKELECDKNGKLNAVGNIMSARSFEELNVESYKERTRAFLKIQEGCSQFCSYCIIPYARGPIRSRPPDEILNEVGRLAGLGFKEVVITGIHIASYGKDFIKDEKNSDRVLLLDIIKKIHDMEGIERIRLGSIEPTTITEEFVKEAQKLAKLCPHYHISLQSGCDETLKRMNRKYNTEEYEQVVKLLRDNIKDVNITTDVMVGFPGETDEEFEKTHKYLKHIELSSMHVFKYSPRKGTPAAAFEGQVEPEKKEERSNLLLSLSKKNTTKFNTGFTGRIFPVLFEQQVKSKEGYFEGFTTNYIKVICKATEKVEGKIINVIMDKAEEDFIVGHAEG